MSLTKALSNKIGNLAAIGGSEDQGELFKSASNVMSKLEQTENKIIKKKIKKGDIINNLSKQKSKMDKPIGKLYSMGKSENKESMGAANAGEVLGPITMTKKEMTEKWSQKYKDSIDCDNPKGFSQKAHCQGKNKKETKEATASGAAGGFVGKTAFNPNSEFVKKSFEETPQKGEFKEATGSASSGSYVTPAAWAKSTSKKDWRGKSKTQIPGGQFVQVKKKCKKFPYCNQGDIKALKLTNEDKLNKMISELSKKHNISESLIKKMIYTEFRNKK
jgi:hypothetical protein